MFYWKFIVLPLLIGEFGALRGSMANSIPTAVALGGAVVAAVEEEEAQQARITELNTRDNEIEIPELSELKNLLFDKNTNEGRGKKHKKEKLLKQLYPLLIGAVIAKAFIVPLVLKGLIALSTSSFIMAKIALAASGIIVLKWLFADSGNDRTRLEIVHFPTKSHGNSDWSDMNWSGSSNYVDIKSTPTKRLKYIPLGSGASAFPNAFMINRGTPDSSDYRYGYDSAFEGKHFL